MNGATLPPPLPSAAALPRVGPFTVIRIILQVILSLPSLLIFPFIMFGIGVYGIAGALKGNPLAGPPAAIGFFYPAGFLLISASIFIPSAFRRWAFIVPFLGTIFFLACAYVLYTKAIWGGDPTLPYRKEKEFAFMFGGSVLVGAWNSIRNIKAQTNAT